MDSGRPALVIPRAGPATLPPRRAIVAWDGSREAARAASDAIPLLQSAELVLVLVVDARDAGGPATSRAPSSPPTWPATGSRPRRGRCRAPAPA